MKITFIGHASILIETNGIRILSDPWWNGPCFGAQWWLYPDAFLAAIEERLIDYVYISHGHHDHFHPPTLRQIDAAAKILVPSDSGLAEAARGLGFEAVEVGDEEELPLGNGVRCRIIKTHAGDSLMTVTDGAETCVNANDALHSCSVEVQDRFAGLLRRYHPRIDYLFCGYGIASHFPNCYVMPGKDPVRSAIRRQQHFNRSWAHIVHAVGPRFGFPFAADVVFLDPELRWSNEPVHNGERPVDVFTRTYGSDGTTVLDIAPGFIIDGGRVVSSRMRAPIRLEAVMARWSDAIRRVDREGQVEPAAVRELAAELSRNIERTRDYLGAFPGSYRVLIVCRGSETAIVVEKTGSKISVGPVELATTRPENYDLVYRTRISYLRNSLATAFGHEVLFVGSGGIFEYLRASGAKSNLHREVMVMVNGTAAPAPRPRGLRRHWHAFKQVVKAVLGRRDVDLYDVASWTVPLR